MDQISTDFSNWYREHYDRFLRLQDKAIVIIHQLLDGHGIEVQATAKRVKGLERALQKIHEKAYTDAKSQLTDTVGLRIVLLTESDAQKAADVFATSLKVHEQFSADKGQALGVDHTGYRALHLICDLSLQMEGMPAYSDFSKMRFEIQIRTILAHAWDEVSRQLLYKVKAPLSSKLQRRLHLIAGMIELADDDFDEFIRGKQQQFERAEEITKELRHQHQLEISPNHIKEYLRKRMEILFGDERIGWDNWPAGWTQTLVEDLKKFGVNRYEEIDRMVLTEEFANLVKADQFFFLHVTTAYPLGLIHTAMLLADIERYLVRVAEGTGYSLGSSSSIFSLLITRNGKPALKEVLDKLNYELIRIPTIGQSIAKKPEKPYDPNFGPRVVNWWSQ